MKKILINKCYGGFSFSDQFVEEYNKRTGKEKHNRSIKRTSRKAIALFEEMGSEWSSGRFAKLKVVEIPDNVKYFIEEYDGMEVIREQHRTWG